MKNKGFTLIELLAVIVILAIIALIATPVILGIIEDTRTSANARTVELVKSGVQNAYTSYLMANNGSYPSSVDLIMDQKYYTVDSAPYDSSTKKISANNGAVTCVVSYTAGTPSGKIVVDCSSSTGSFPTDFNNKPEFTATVK